LSKIETFVTIVGVVQTPTWWSLGATNDAWDTNHT